MRHLLGLAMVAAGHAVLARGRQETARLLAPPPRCQRRGRPRKSGVRLTPEQGASVPVTRRAQILDRPLEGVSDRTCCCRARWRNGAVVRVVWGEVARPDRPGRRVDPWLLVCPAPTRPPLEVIGRAAQRWAVESLVGRLTPQCGRKPAWPRRRQVLRRGGPSWPPAWH